MSPPDLQPGEEHCCPRCGYDLLGSRPADVNDALRCPECGLETTWQRLNDPRRFDRDWHLECTERASPRAALKTAWVTLFPSWLWSWVTLELPIHRGRLVRFAALFLALTHLSVAAYAGLNAWVLNTWAPLTEHVSIVGAKLVRPPATDRPLTSADLDRLDHALLSALGATAEYGGMIDLGLNSYGIVYPDGGSPLREAVTQWAAAGELSLPAGEAEAWVDAVRAVSAKVLDALEEARTRQRVKASARAVLLPYATIRIGARDLTPTSLRTALTLSRIGLLTAAIMPLAFLLLRQSMRIARVRSVHLLRVFAYCQPPVFAFTGLVVLLASFASFADAPFSRQDAMLCFELPVLTGLALWASVWFVRIWQLFVTQYLRLQHAPGVLAAMLALSLVSACFLCFFIWDRDGVTRLLGAI